MAIRLESIKSAVPFLTGLALGAGFAALEKNFPRVRLQTNPQISRIQKIADEVLELAVMRFLNVYSHHWHWTNTPYDSKFDEFGIHLEGAPGNPHNNPFFGVIAHLGGRPYGHIVKGEMTDTSYFLAFKHPGSNHIRRCNIGLKEPVMLLAGPDSGCIVYAMDKKGDPLRVNLLTGLIHRKDKPGRIRIL